MIKTIPELLNQTQKNRGQGIAIVDRTNSVSYTEFEERVHRLACGLKAQGLKKGDLVGIWLPNITAYLEFFCACGYLGVTVVSVNTKFKSFEMSDIVSRSNCKMLILWPDFKNIPFLDILSEIPDGELQGLESVVFYTEGEPFPSEIPSCISDKRIISYRDLVDTEPTELPAVAEDDGLVIFTTSGTTGKPKFVFHHHHSIVQHAYDVASNFEFDKRACRLLQVNPLCGTFGLTQALAGLSSGATVYCVAVFNGGEAARIMTEEKITDVFGSDDMFSMMLANTEGSNPFPDLQYAGFAAFNPALTQLVADADKKNVKLVGLWGMSEVQAFVAHQDPKAPIEERRLGGGKLMSDAAEIRITDPETGNRLPIGEKGELEIRCPSQMAGYLGNPEATKKTITSDGFIRTGDLAIQTDDRHFTFLSRMGDVLRLGGYLTDPVEIESCLKDHPSVEKAQVVGVESDKGARAFAFVILKQGALWQEEEVSAFCKSRLAGYKVPAGFEVLEAFPTTLSANGEKVQRSKLREQAQNLWSQKGAN
ncbi:AMP-binding protein [Sneathiella limimaris]|uniref:AMP-binding protein n=1 Tax=Sneathiella limimaris TaxID=1964213 RepID=UPI00146D5D26|nr:AMP-binding protein [Sneathiella limimaris]